MRNIIIVEDSVAMKHRLVALFNEIGGLRLTGAYDSAESAIQSLEQEIPDIVVLDYVLKEGTGMQVLREVRRRALSTVVIVFTQYDDDSYREWFLDAGADHVIVKTRETQRLRDTLYRLSLLP